MTDPYKVLGIDPSATDEAFDQLGKYALKTGNQKLLDEYRETVVIISSNTASFFFIIIPPHPTNYREHQRRGLKCLQMPLKAPQLR